MENFTLAELNDMLTAQSITDYTFVSATFAHINASDEAMYNVDCSNDKEGSIYITDRGEDYDRRYNIATHSLQTAADIASRLGVVETEDTEGVEKPPAN